ncbi:MAG: hypothetical protein KIS66_08740 [Fimbriimonadaceae bacterium]|nr:hypothetical protein [Fimbriimonadaceae bacterium]
MTLQIDDAPVVRLPGAYAPWSGAFESDCNCPSHWEGSRFVVFSSARDPWRAEGSGVEHLGNPVAVTFDLPVAGGRWLEATHRRSDGTLFGWYHFEPDGPFADRGVRQTEPRIGAARSLDGGRSWEDLGVVLAAPMGSERFDTRNAYFAGGVGDFCVLPDRLGERFYVFYGSYGGSASEQGVCVGRMDLLDLERPIGKVSLWDGRAFCEPGLGGRGQPIIPVGSDWHGEKPDAFWGPSVHYNTFLDAYVMVLNRAIDAGWAQEGLYVSFNRDLTDPTGWTKPLRFMEGGGWYPLVVGDPPYGTDKLAGEAARLFVGGESRWRVRFEVRSVDAGWDGRRL